MNPSGVVTRSFQSKYFGEAIRQGGIEPFSPLLFESSSKNNFRCIPIRIALESNISTDLFMPRPCLREWPAHFEFSSFLGDTTSPECSGCPDSKSTF